MKPATLYTLHQAEVLAGSSFEIARIGPVDCIFADDGTALAPRTVDKISVPVHCVTRCVTEPSEVPLEGANRHESEAFYIAMEPALAEILEAPYRGVLEATRREADGMRKRIESFERLPWHRRIWAAIRKSV